MLLDSIRELVPASGNACSSYKIISYNTYSVYKLVFCDYSFSIKYECYLGGAQVVFLEGY